MKMFIQKRRKKCHKSYLNLIIIPMLLTWIIAYCFFYERVRLSQYEINGDCVYIPQRVSPSFTLGFIGTESNKIDEIKIEDKTIFKLNDNKELEKINNEFETGKKKIEIIFLDKSTISDTVCIIDRFRSYWLTISKKDKNSSIEIKLDPVSLD